MALTELEAWNESTKNIVLISTANSDWGDAISKILSAKTKEFNVEVKLCMRDYQISESIANKENNIVAVVFDWTNKTRDFEDESQGTESFKISLTQKDLSEILTENNHEEINLINWRKRRRWRINGTKDREHVLKEVIKTLQEKEL